MNKFLSRQVDASLLALAVSILLATVPNISFWSRFVEATGGISLEKLPLLLGAFAIIVLFLNACLTIVSFRFVAKPTLIALLLTTSLVTYFMNQYGVVIDKGMVQNVFETDIVEAVELFNWQLVFTVLSLGVLPSVLVARANVRFPSGARGWLKQIAIAGGSLLLAIVLLVVLFKALAPTVRENRDLRYLLTPTNYIQALNGYLRNRFSAPVVIAPLGRDAIKGAAWAGHARRTATIIVVGETARAMNFSLNGYARGTNPMLAQQDGLINFTQVQSCGTATAVSLPCVFSAFDREHYSDSKGRGQEGLLHVLSHAGLRVVWRDNNSGCKGACDGLPFEDFTKPAPNDPNCLGDECYDERLLNGLPELIRTSDKDLVIVLHQKGSHGPAYAKRYPKGFGRFGPVCDTSEFEKCTQESIVAAYDNTILYTDFVLSKAIDLLRRSSEDDNVDTALLYFSDHGESLGEGNLYLHGAPYIFAPKEQTHIPMMLWMSDRFSERFHHDRSCLMARRQQPFSHDNVFHSVLGMLNVNTAVLNPKLDLFNACTRGP